MDKKTKKRWFKQIAVGDKVAFDAFFEHYYPKLIHFARIYVHCPQQAEDIVSEVLTNLLIHRERVFALDHFEAYLYSSVKNKALTYLKKLQIMESEVNEDSYPSLRISGSDPYQLLEQKEFNDYILRVIGNLPPKRKKVFQMIREEGLSYREVAGLMEISERTVEVHLKLAIKDLRVSIEYYLDKRVGKKNKKDPLNALLPILFFNFLNL